MIVHSGLYKPVDAPNENWPIEESPNAFTANDTSKFINFNENFVLII